MQSRERVAVIGLGYVGLPVALALARCFPDVVGFDVDEHRIAALAQGRDETGETPPEALRGTRLRFSADAAALVGTSFFIIAVPTPVDAAKRPDLSRLAQASETVGRVLRPNAVVVVESTVYPGTTEEFCAPILERVSGLKRPHDFAMGYSPERINPGDAEHRLERVTKVVAAETPDALARVAALYGAIVPAGVHSAPSIQVAETAKVLENTQRDLNIALMNEVAVICDRLGIATRDVLAAARTKWNFLPFTPGLVGGHCIGVDPYYLTARAEAFGYTPQVILAGRRINDDMGRFIAQRLIKMLVRGERPWSGARVAIFGLAFKENVSDIRNSRVPDVVRELAQFGISALIHDPLASPAEALAMYDCRLADWASVRELDAALFAVPHREYLAEPQRIVACVKPGGVLVDVKAALPQSAIRGDIRYWSL